MQVGGGDAKKSEAAAAEISGLRGGERQAVPTQSASGGQQGCTIVDNVCTTTCQLRDTWEAARRLPGLQLVITGRECIEA